MSSDATDRTALEREIKARQQSLATTVDELADRVAPKNVARRTAATATTKAKTTVLDDDGALRVGRVGAVAGALVALLGAVIWRRSR